MAYQEPLDTRNEASSENVSLDVFREELCADAYFDLLSSLYQASPISAGQGDHFASSTFWYTDRCFFGVEQVGPMVSVKNKRHVQDTGHLVVVERIVSGREFGFVEDDPNEGTKPGVIAIADQGRAFELASTGVSGQYFFTSKAEIGFDPDRHGFCVEVFPTTGIGKLLDASLDRLFDAALHHGDSVPATILDETFACLKIALGAPPQREDVRAHAREALFNLITRHIEDNLADLDLSAETVLAEFGLSRASLYRMFEPYGGVRNYIMERRTARAVLQIAASPPERGLMRRVAETWGFSTQPNFNRTIHRMFGTSPGNLFSKDKAARECRLADRPSGPKFNALTALGT